MVSARTATALRAATAAGQAASARPARAFHSSRIISAADHGHASNGEKYVRDESFNTPFWRWTMGSSLVVWALYRLNDSSSARKQMPVIEGEEAPKDQPFLTRYLDYNLTQPQGKWQKEQEKQLEEMKGRKDYTNRLRSLEYPVKARGISFDGGADRGSLSHLALGTKVDFDS